MYSTSLLAALTEVDGITSEKRCLEVEELV